MNSMTDQQLLREYTEHRAEPAFGELVRRHVDLVYSAALRMVRDAHLAEDVTQAVFTALSQSAGRLTDRAVLSGWLHRTTQNLAANAVRSDVRRRAREQEAAAMNDSLFPEPDVPWESIAPHLDAALGELNEADRDALLLRYFERKSAREMAQSLGTSEEAAQKRVTRAVERLRDLLAKRGVTAGAGALVALLSAHAVQAAPVGLALSITTSTVLAGTAVATLAASTAAKTLAMTTLQKVLVAASLAVAVGVGSYQTRQAFVLRAQVRTLQQQRTSSPEPTKAGELSSLQARLGRLEAQNSELASALTQAKAEKIRLETERGQARHSAALFKELADQATAKQKNPTNEFATARDVWTAWGRLGRFAAQAKKDDSKLSAAEKAAKEVAKFEMLAQLPALVKAFKQLEQDQSGGSGGPGQEDMADSFACLLYGALNLDQQQFGQVYGVIQKYVQQAKAQDFSGKAATPEKAAVLKQMMEQFTTEIKGLLTPEQTEIFAGVVSHFHVTPGNASFNFNF